MIVMERPVLSPEAGRAWLLEYLALRDERDFWERYRDELDFEKQKLLFGDFKISDSEA